jgi:RimJ/RimL family protein N-acetyltransferase
VSGGAVALAPMDEGLRPGVLALEVEPSGERFAGRPARSVPVADADPAREQVAVLCDGVVVGYFQLDRNSVPGAPSGRDILGLRAFLIDRRRHGEGIAGAAMAALPAYVRERFPEHRTVALTVNVDNPVAIAVYRRAGFVDAGTGVWHGGGAGPQHVLLLDVGAGAG